VTSRRKRAVQAVVLASGAAMTMAAFKAYFSPSVVINLLGMAWLC
jgi:hypothetical protein